MTITPLQNDWTFYAVISYYWRILWQRVVVLIPQTIRDAKNWKLLSANLGQLKYLIKDLIAKSLNRVFFSLTVNTKSSSNTLLQKLAPVLKKLHWRPVRCRIIYKFFLLVYRVLSDASPYCVRDLTNYSLLLTFFMYVKITFLGFWRLQKIHWKHSEKGQERRQDNGNVFRAT